MRTLANTRFTMTDDGSQSPPSQDPFDLTRFLSAQASDYPRALAEVRAGQKQSHWMWYIFPQFAGLGSSGMSRQYAIRSPAEGRAYLDHPILGARLREIAEAALVAPGGSASVIFGSPDDLKLRSCATLFATLSPAGSVFHRLLDRFFDGDPDAGTIRLIEASR